MPFATYSPKQAKESKDNIKSNSKQNSKKNIYDCLRKITEELDEVDMQEMINRQAAKKFRSSPDKKA